MADLALSGMVAEAGPRAAPAVAGAAPDSVMAVLSAPGAPLEAATRAYFEPRFGRDLGTVRVHADDRAADSARAVDAAAYTVGDRMVFGAGRYAPHTHEGRRLIAHELAHVAQQARFPGAPALMRQPAKPPVPTPGATPYNFISESPALENWKVSVKEMLEREFGKTFATFEEAQGHFRKHLEGLPDDAARETYADRMRDRARKAFYRREAKNPSYNYKPEDIAKLKNGAAPESGLQLEHMEDVKSKTRGGVAIKGRPERALDPGNIYVTEGGARGTAPTGSKHAEKYRTIEEAKRRSREIRKVQTPAEGATKQAPAAKAPTPAPNVAPKTAPVGPPVQARPPTVAPPQRPAVSPWRTGLRAGAGAAAWTAAFMALDYIIQKDLEARLEKDLESIRSHMGKWAAREKENNPNKPVYLRLIIRSEQYSRYVVLLGWLADPPKLFVSSSHLTDTPIDPPVTSVQDDTDNFWRPGKTITVTYTELLIP